MQIVELVLYAQAVLPQPVAPFSVRFLSDPHVGYYQTTPVWNTAQVTAEAALIRALAPACAVVLGDMGGGETAAVQAREAFLAARGPLTVPWLWVCGNHDLMLDSTKALWSMATMPGLDTSAYGDNVHWPYAWVQGGWLFFALDANVRDGTRVLPESIPQWQLDALLATRDWGLPTCVLVHEPFARVDPGSGNLAPVLENGLAQLDALAALASVKLIVHGHLHESWLFQYRGVLVLEVTLPGTTVRFHGDGTVTTPFTTWRRFP